MVLIDTWRVRCRRLAHEDLGKRDNRGLLSQSSVSPFQGSPNAAVSTFGPEDTERACVQPPNLIRRAPDVVLVHNTKLYDHEQVVLFPSTPFLRQENSGTRVVCVRKGKDRSM